MDKPDYVRICELTGMKVEYGRHLGANRDTWWEIAEGMIPRVLHPEMFSTTEAAMGAVEAWCGDNGTFRLGSFAWQSPTGRVKRYYTKVFRDGRKVGESDADSLPAAIVAALLATAERGT